MKITIIYGSPRKGNTYDMTQLFKKEMTACGDAEFTEFFMPQALPEFCKGCMSCFYNGEQTCPHAEYTLPIFDSLVGADAFIFNTPVYVMQTSGALKTFLDHYGFMFIIHRARPEMFNKKAFVFSTAAGAGTGAAIKTIVTNLKMWGVNRVYSLGFAMRAVDWDTVNTKRREKLERKLKKSARRFYNEILSGKKHSPYLFTRMMFTVCRGMLKKYDDSLDKRYWSQMNWFKKNPF
jgi:multimeric flavodoxin WrbA